MWVAIVVDEYCMAGVGTLNRTRSGTLWDFGSARDVQPAVTAPYATTSMPLL